MESAKPDIIKYLECMEEAKLRIQLIRSVLARTTSVGREDFDAELMFIQLRKTLELIAFASMSANKEKYAEAYCKYSTHWNAELMLKDLERINCDFYPAPLKIASISPNGVKNIDFIQDGFLTKADFIKLYNLCGRALHARNPYSTKDPVIQLGYSLEEWTTRINNLLAFHRARMVENTSGWIVTLYGNSDGKAHAFPFEAK
jgi:hypothetical protein